ncbi:hypothetical protein VB780_24615 [Leptolyngbya sp. CCNP1308]|uniref:hypothetical protein n=1 Tax=Leptolyngbya sp. CCNP1308 TaxID=3110255 RepID=UPI002B1F1FBC|nr:hypothetical protein [Leptolyngbya sp. CCNP1308]MEA5451783.1 hypothetical protein [Leptolyngbya sp. CCNP1308]
MTDFFEEFVYQDIHCFRYAAAPTRFYYVPGAPVPQRDAQSRTAISLMKVGEKGFLQLTSQWCLSPLQLDELRAALAEQCSDVDPATLQVAFAPVTVEEVSLVLTPKAEKPQVLGTSGSSGYPPYAAVFSVNLTEAQQDSVAEALSGERDRLMVRYWVALQKQVTSEGSFSLDSPRFFQTTKAAHRLTQPVSLKLERTADVADWT